MKNKTKLLYSLVVGVILIAATILSIWLIKRNAFAKYDGELTVIVYDENERELINKKIKFKAGESLVEVLEENIDIEFETHELFGRFIVRIAGKAQGDGYYWTYTRNDELTDTGIDSQEFSNGDVFKFTLVYWG